MNTVGLAAVEFKQRALSGRPMSVVDMDELAAVICCLSPEYGQCQRLVQQDFIQRLFPSMGIDSRRLLLNRLLYLVFHEKHYGTRPEIIHTGSKQRAVSPPHVNATA